MKTTNKLFKRLLVLPLAVVLLGFASCDDDEHKNVTPSGTDGPATVTMFTPTAGGKNTTITLYGSHFGTDINNIRVTVNGDEITVKNSSGNVITATVPRGTTSGEVKVYITRNGEVQELTYGQEFEYSLQPTVSTYLGAFETVTGGKDDGSFETAKFYKPAYLAWKGNDLYIIEEKGDFPATIRVARNNQISTILNATTDAGTIDRPRALAVSQDENTLFIGNDMNAAGPISFGKMTWGTSEYENAANIWSGESVTALAVHPRTGDIFFVGYSNDSWIYKYDKTTAAITKVAQLTVTDGGAPVAKPNASCVLFDKNSTDFYVAAKGKHIIFKGIYNDATDTFSGIHLWAGIEGSGGFADGPVASAKFNEPWQIDLDAEGNLFVADRKNHRVRKITPAGEVSTYAGDGVSGTTDGLLTNARFNHPQGLTFGADGAMYIADFWNHRIRKIEAD